MKRDAPDRTRPQALQRNAQDLHSHWYTGTGNGKRKVHQQQSPRHQRTRRRPGCGKSGRRVSSTPAHPAEDGGTKQSPTLESCCKELQKTPQQAPPPVLLPRGATLPAQIWRHNLQAQQLKSPRQSSSSLCASEKKTLAHAQVLQRSPSLLGCLVCVEQFAVFAGSSWQVHKQRNRPCRPWLPDFKILPCFSASAAFLLRALQLSAAACQGGTDCMRPHAQFHPTLFMRIHP